MEDRQRVHGVNFAGRGGILSPGGLLWFARLFLCFGKGSTMSRIVFKSLADPNSRRYVVESNRLFDRCDNEMLSPHIGWFETYGDGDCQHCPNSPVGVALFCDFCASAAEYLSGVAVSDAEELCRILSSEMKHFGMVDGDRIRALRAVVYKEGKRRWFDRSTGKVSASDSKRHDRRWEEVVQWMDGGFDAVLGLVGGGRGSFLYVAAVYQDFREVWRIQTGDDGKNPWQFFEWLYYSVEECYHAFNAFNALRLLVKSWECKQDAARSLECWQSNEALYRERKADAA